MDKKRKKGASTPRKRKEGEEKKNLETNGDSGGAVVKVEVLDEERKITEEKVIEDIIQKNGGSEKKHSVDERGLSVAKVGGKTVHVCCAQYFDDERKRDGLEHHPCCPSFASGDYDEHSIPELIYFDGPGRGELIRLMLHAGGVPFHDRRVTFKEFVAMKGDPSSLPMQRFGSVPILEHNGMILAQSIAIQQYASDLAFANCNISPQRRAIDLMHAATHAEIQTAMYACLFGTADSKRKARENLPVVVDKFLGSIESTLPEDGSYIHGGDVPSLADLAIFDVCTSKFPGLFMLGEDISPYRRVVALLHKIREFEPLQKYLLARRF